MTNFTVVRIDELFPWRRRWEVSLKDLLQCQRITRRCLFNADYPFCSLNFSFRIHVFLSQPYEMLWLQWQRKNKSYEGFLSFHRLRTAFQCSDWIQSSLSFISMSSLITISEVVLHIHYVKWYYLEANLGGLD